MGKVRRYQRADRAYRVRTRAEITSNRRLSRPLLGLLCLMLPSAAVAEQQLTVDIYEQYSFEFRDRSYEHDCEVYISQALASINQQRPFCAIDDIGRWLQKGWKIQYTTRLNYTVVPKPKVDRWDCDLFRVECSGERFYLFGG